MKRTVFTSLFRKVSFWFAKQVLVTLPVIGPVLNLVFAGAELIEIAHKVLVEDAEPVPQWTPAMA